MAQATMEIMSSLQTIMTQFGNHTSNTIKDIRLKLADKDLLSVELEQFFDEYEQNIVSCIVTADKKKKEKKVKKHRKPSEHNLRVKECYVVVKDVYGNTVKEQKFKLGLSNNMAKLMKSGDVSATDALKPAVIEYNIIKETTIFNEDLLTNNETNNETNKETTETIIETSETNKENNKENNTETNKENNNDNTLVNKKVAKKAKPAKKSTVSAVSTRSSKRISTKKVNDAEKVEEEVEKVEKVEEVEKVEAEEEEEEEEEDEDKLDDEEEEEDGEYDVMENINNLMK
jgi:hypothetical protein